MKYIVMILALLPNTVHAHDVIFVVHELSSNEKAFYSYNVSTRTLSEAQDVEGSPIICQGPFSILKQSLMIGDKQLTAADEILLQCEADKFWFLVIRDEYNSYSNPWRWFAAFIGHPVQVSKIIVLLIKDGKVVSKHQIKKKPSSYRWKAMIMKRAAYKP